MKTRLFKLLFLALVLGLLLLPTAAFAAEIIDSEVCTEDMSWTLDSEGTLTIKGRRNVSDTYYLKETNMYYYAGWLDHTDKIKSLVIEGFFVQIDSGTFSTCSQLTRVSMCDSITFIGSSAFAGCQNLTEVDFSENLEQLQGGAFRNCTALKKLILPDTLTLIGDYAFAGCTGLAELDLSAGLRRIAAEAFAGCTSLTEVTIPQGVEELGNGVFECCDGLQSVTILPGVTAIGDQAFSDCSQLTSVALPNTLTDLGNYAFSGCRKLSSVTLPASLTNVGYSAFHSCEGLKEMTIPRGVTRIPYDCFIYCSGLDHVTIQGENVEIGEGAFRKCTALTDVAVEGSVSKVGPLAFNECENLSSINFPQGLKTVCYQAFEGCYMLPTLTFPASLTEIEFSAFAACFSLQEVYFKGDAPIFGESCFFFASPRGYYPAGNTTWTEEARAASGISAWSAYESGPDSFPFRDVDKNAYYYSPISWASSSGITSGTSATTFSPEVSCTRAQVVTFLWRANGSPEPESTHNPFSDVENGQYYTKAILWAVEQDITTGIGGGRFGTLDIVTRGQFVTFLWRALGSPAVSGRNPFTDVANGAFYTQPILWALEKGVTSGVTATSFQPDSPCTRGQVVTFLYRAYGK